MKVPWPFIAFNTDGARAQWEEWPLITGAVRTTEADYIQWIKNSADNSARNGTFHETER